MFVLPIVFLLWLLVSNMNAEIAFAQKERLGVSYNRAMLSLLQHMQQHRGMASGLLNGDGSFAPRLEAMAPIELKGKSRPVPVFKVVR